jgi:RNA polymerase sigma-70 factor (ECF subfamily)
MSDPAEISSLLLRHRHGLLAYLHAAVRDTHTAEDLFQEVSLVAVRQAADYVPGTNFSAWARAIARLKLLEQLRRRSPGLLSLELLDGLERDFAALEAEGDLDGRKDALRRCLEKLGARARDVLALRYHEGLSAEAIAARTRRSRAAVNSLLQRLRETLRACADREARLS